MKIQYASDLHLEFSDNSMFFLKNPLNVTGDILILAGDIHVFDHPEFLQDQFWDWASKNYKQVIIAFGNHEFYRGYDLSQMKDGFKYKIRDNVYYYYNCVLNFDETDIIISTLWSYIPKGREYACEHGVNDFRLIKYGNKILNSSIFNDEHEKCLKFIKKSLNESKAFNKIIVTHHVPSNLLNAEEYKDSEINGAFTVDLTDYIKTCGAKYWIFGHSHRNINKDIGNTKCVCNQFGYFLYGENFSFNNSAFIDLTNEEKINEK